MSESKTPTGPAGPGRDLPVNPEWEVHPVQVKLWLDAGEDIVLLDVRQTNEWNFCRLEGAVLAPLPRLGILAHGELQSLQHRRVVAYCHHGVRSLRAAALLRQAGFDSVHSLAGGIEAWSLLVDSTVPRY